MIQRSPILGSPAIRVSNTVTVGGGRVSGRHFLCANDQEEEYISVLGVYDWREQVKRRKEWGTVVHLTIIAKVKTKNKAT